MSAVVTERGAALGAPSGVADGIVFDAETEAQLALINPVTAEHLRSIARKLDEAEGSYASGYLAGVRKRLGVAVKAEPVVAELAPAVPETLDMTAVERGFDDIYTGLQEWAAKVSTPERTYVSAGHETVAAIDDAVRALHALRAELVAEIRRDADERNVLVDALLAESRARREALASEVTA